MLHRLEKKLAQEKLYKLSCLKAPKIRYVLIKAYLGDIWSAPNSFSGQRGKNPAR